MIEILDLILRMLNMYNIKHMYMIGITDDTFYAFVSPRHTNEMDIVAQLIVSPHGDFFLYGDDGCVQCANEKEAISLFVLEILKRDVLTLKEEDIFP